MKVQIKYFASIREAVGSGAESLETTATTVTGLRDELDAQR
jgi:molybdopterin synthase sulfur carrier subunit